MNGKNARLARKAATDAAEQTGRRAADVSLGVLEYARKIELKVNGIDAAVTTLETKAQQWDGRTFSGRLRWLLTGR